jgi:hypothetical protein
VRRSATAAKRQRVKAADQRREPRDTGKGDISLVFADTNATSGVREVYGRLIDHSARGFRAVHEFRGLTCGQMVQFRVPASSEGRARVVWTRIAGGQVETGFFIVT